MLPITCMEIDGICSTPIEGGTFEEWYVNYVRHLQEASLIYPDHQKVLDDRSFMSDNEKERQKAKFKKKWEAANGIN